MGAETREGSKDTSCGLRFVIKQDGFQQAEHIDSKERRQASSRSCIALPTGSCEVPSLVGSRIMRCRRRITRCSVLLAWGTASGLRPLATGVRRLGPHFAEDCEAAEGDVVVFALPDTVDPPGVPGERRLGVVKAEMSCTAWVHPLVEQGADQGDDEVMLVEDEAFEEPVQCQGGIESVIDDVFYGQLPVPSLGGGVGYGATAVECWTLVRDQVPDGVDVPVSDAGVAPWTH